MWNFKREEQLVLIILLCAFVAGLGIKLKGGIPEVPPSPSRILEVKIAGAVKKPGLYRLPENSSIGDLIRMAKGTLPWADLSSLDLTAPLSSDIVYIPEGKLNLNQASVEDLTFLPGIGPELARRIVRYREEKGGFDNLSQLKDVPGIGEIRFAKIKNKLTLK